MNRVRRIRYSRRLHVMCKYNLANGFTSSSRPAVADRHGPASPDQGHVLHAKHTGGISCPSMSGA